MVLYTSPPLFTTKGPHIHKSVLNELRAAMDGFNKYASSIEAFLFSESQTSASVIGCLLVKANRIHFVQHPVGNNYGLYFPFSKIY